jgi:CHASE2 domain-containing sensor protein
MRRIEHRQPFLREFGRGVLLIALAVAFTALGHRTSAVRGLERANLDILYALQGWGVHSDIDIVEITDSDYERLFNRHSPLDPATVVQIINGIAVAGAKVIGVDILTESWPVDALRGLDQRVPIVWIREVDRHTGAAAGLGPVLGAAGDSVCQGPEAIHQIFGVAREFEPFVRVAGNGLVPSFTRVIEAKVADPASAGCGHEAPAVASEEIVEPIPFIGPAGVFRRFSAATILTAMHEPEWRQNQVMKGHIVLLGGTFPASRDYYDTPVQEGMYGVAILANIIGGRIFAEAHWTAFLVIDIAVGLVLLTIGYYVGSVWRLGLITALIIAISFGSLLLFQYFRFYLSLMPVLVGIAIHFLLELFHHQRELRREYAELQAKNAALVEEIDRLKADQPVVSRPDENGGKQGGAVGLA